LKNVSACGTPECRKWHPGWEPLPWCNTKFWVTDQT